MSARSISVISPQDVLAAGPRSAERVSMTLLGILLVAQGAHTVEHVVQVIQYHVLQWPMQRSQGLVSAANSEWIHFVWNWSVLLILGVVVLNGMRNRWTALLLVWATAHALEHAYLLVQFLQVQTELAQLGVTSLLPQGLPGVLGHDGWLARSSATQGTLFCQLPGLTTAPRLDIHFWWNAGEITLLVQAGRQIARRGGRSSANAGQARLVAHAC
jgi:hypothetical protein